MSQFVLPVSEAAKLGYKAIKTINEQLGYDFVGLITKLIVYFATAFIIETYVRIVLGTTNAIVNAITGALQFLGYNIPTKAPDFIVKFVTEGYQGVKYWDIIKGAAVIAVTYEGWKYYDNNEKRGITTSPVTMLLFILISGFLTLITIPELIQRLKEAKVIKI